MFNLAAVVNLGQHRKLRSVTFFSFTFAFFFKRNKHKTLYTLQHGNRNLVKTMYNLIRICKVFYPTSFVHKST